MSLQRGWFNRQRPLLCSCERQVSNCAGGRVARIRGSLSAIQACASPFSKLSCTMYLCRRPHFAVTAVTVAVALKSRASPVPTVRVCKAPCCRRLTMLT